MQILPFRALRLAALGIGLAALASTSSAAAGSYDLDAECLVTVAKAKDDLQSNAERRAADLTMMYYIGRLSSRMPAAEITAEIARFRREATADESNAATQRCLMETLRDAIELGAINDALEADLK